MKILSKQRYFDLASENCFAVKKSYGNIYLIADIEKKENDGAKFLYRIEEYPHWILPDGKSLLEGFMQLRDEKCGGITFNEDCENAHNELLGYLSEEELVVSQPVIIYASNDLETTDILKLIPDGCYIVVIGDEESVNEFDNPENRTPNFMDYKRQMSKICISDVYNVLSTMQRLEENGILSDAVETSFGSLKEIMNNLKTGEKCSKCGSDLYKSDLPQYDFYCIECDENF